MQVLVAEDELITRRMLKGLLVKWGYDVVTASDGREALQILLQDDGPKLAILDWTMPELTGLEVCEQVRQVETSIPPHLILLTARTSSEDVVAGLNSGASDYIRKPFDQQELQARIRVGQAVVELQINVARRMQEFEEYVDDSPLGIIMVENDGSISFANNSAYAIFGYEKGELIGQDVELLVWSSYRGRHYGLREAYFKRPDPRMMAGRTSLFGQKKDGTLVPVSVGLNPIPRDTAERVACTVFDLSQLRAAEDRFDQFFELSLDIFCIAHLNGDLVKFNSNLGRMLGYTFEELKSLKFYDLFHPDEVASAKAQVDRLTSGQVVNDYRSRWRNKDGTVYWIEWNARAISNAGLIYAVGRNITDRLRAEQELQHHATREVALLNNAPAIISIADLQGRYEFVNNRHAELYSGSPAMAIGKKARDFFSETEARRMTEQEQQVIRTGEAITTTEVATRAGDDHSYVSVKFPLRNSNGQVSATATIAIDVTEDFRNRDREREIQLNKAFRQHLHPTQGLSQYGIEIAGAAKSTTGQCTDYFDYFKFGPEHLILAMGGVTGQSIVSAVHLTKVSCTARILARLVRSLPVIMSELNQDLCESLPKGSSINLFLAEIDPANGGLSYLGAGHGGFVVRADGTAGRLKSTHGPLGVMASAAFLSVVTVPINRGDVLVLLTDGLVEAMNSDRKRFGEKRIADVVRRVQRHRPQQIVQSLFQALDEYTGPKLRRDDVTAVVMKVAE